ncbi:MAG: GlsB/YeaQ/YmgE family stress response membrane protein [Bacteroidia bacterium]|nr:GlsB/YeaQ/YmgE family stress response membrane protein [Bacteroidia bacterium]
MFSFLWFLLVGLAAGAIAKMLTPQQEKGGWISSMAIGVVGAVVGGWIAGMIPVIRSIADLPIVGQLLTAVGGAFLVLWIYHKFLADKLNLPI